MPKIRTTLNIDKSLWDGFKVLAQSNKRSASAQLEWIMSQALANQKSYTREDDSSDSHSPISAPGAVGGALYKQSARRSKLSA